MRIVIYGIGTTGTKLAQTLYNEGQDITIIDSNKKKVEAVRGKLDAICILGQIGEDSVVKDSKIKDADVFIAVTDSDEENIVSCIIAKKQGAKKTIARLRNLSYLDPEMLSAEDIGIDHIINPEKEVAKEIFRLISTPWAMEVDAFIKGRLSLIEIKVNPSNIDYLKEKLKKVSEKSLTLILDSEEKRKKVRFFKEGESFNINDKIYLLEETKELEKVNMIFSDSYPKINNVIIMGGGQTAVELLTLLENTDVKVKLIESSRKTCNKLSARFKKSLILCGDATDLDLLTSENIDKADCFVAVTGDDENNIMISLFAEQKGVKKSITKVTKQYGEEILTGIGLYAAVNIYKVTVNKILSFVSRRELIAVSLLHNDVELLEFSAGPGSRITRKTFKSRQFVGGAIIGAIYHQGKIIFPRSPFQIEPGSRVILFADKDTVPKVEKYFRS